MKFNGTQKTFDTKIYFPDIPYDDMLFVTNESMVNFLPGSDSTAYEQFPSFGFQKQGAMFPGKTSENVSEQVLRHITGDGEEQEEGDEFSKLLTIDCEGQNNLIETSYSGYRILGVNPISQKREKCDRANSIFENDGEEYLADFNWKPTLESAKEKPAPVAIFDNLEELKKSLSSAETRIWREKFDTAVLLSLGEVPIQKYTLANERIEVDVLDFGATVSAVRVRHRGAWVDVALGFDNVAGYMSSSSDGLGGTIGRVATKIENGRFKLVNESGLQEVQLSRNANGHHINGGFYPLHKRLWKGTVCGERLVLSVSCQDGEDGYPGALEVWAAFSLSGDCALDVEYSAKADAVTPVCIANGLVFNLAGHDAGAEKLYNHSVFVNAELCCDPSEEVNGKLGLVYQTPYDLTDMKHLGCVMKREGRGSLDVTYALFRSKAVKKNPLEMSPKTDMIIAAVLRDEESGRTLTVSSDQWALRLATWGSGLKGKEGADYRPNAGIRLQPTGLPDAANIDNFPNIFITPYDPYHHCVRYCFTSVKQDIVEKHMLSNGQPWLNERTFLSCDKPPEKDEEKSEEINTLYPHTFETLEKLVEQKCSDNFFDDDSLSLHSSFTSFGSVHEDPPREGISELEEHADQKLVEGESFISLDEHPECAEMHVMVPCPLPPYLVGKWPLKFPEDSIPVPSKKDCLNNPPDSPEPPGDDALPTLPDDKKKFSSVKTDIPLTKTAQPIEYNPTENKIMEGAIKEINKAETEVVEAPGQIILGLSSSDWELEGVENPVLEQGGSVFRWFESPQRLPWYCGAPGRAGLQEPMLPEVARRKRMGSFFKLVNFAEEYKDFEGTPEDLLRAINLKVECLKAHYSSIKSSRGHRQNEAEDEA